MLTSVGFRNVRPQFGNDTNSSIPTTFLPSFKQISAGSPLFFTLPQNKNSVLKVENANTQHNSAIRITLFFDLNQPHTQPQWIQAKFGIQDLKPISGSARYSRLKQLEEGLEPQIFTRIINTFTHQKPELDSSNQFNGLPTPKF